MRDELHCTLQLFLLLKERGKYGQRIDDTRGRTARIHCVAEAAENDRPGVELFFDVQASIHLLQHAGHVIHRDHVVNFLAAAATTSRLSALLQLLVRDVAVFVHEEALVAPLAVI